MTDPNPTTTTSSFGGAIALGEALFRDEVIVVAGAGTLLRGTVLGRVAATGKLRPWAADSADGSQTAVAVLAYSVEVAGAGDVAARVLVEGNVVRNRLIIAADGNGTNITSAIVDQLRDVGITPVDAQGIGQVA